MRDGEPAHLPGRKPQAVLAMLLLCPNQVVSSGRLKDGLWGERPPAGATNALQVFVSRIRAALGERGSRSTQERSLVTAAGGYMIRTAPESVDMYRFERLLREGRDAHAYGDAAAASRLIGEALDLWSGEALVGVATEPFAACELARLEELRLAAYEARLSADLDLGRHDEISPELGRMARRYPGRERITELLMVALYRCGRQSDALNVYDAHRHMLIDRVGLEPGPSVRNLQRRILTQDPALSPPGLTDTRVEPIARRPRRGRPGGMARSRLRGY